MEIKRRTFEFKQLGQNSEYFYARGYAAVFNFVDSHQDIIQKGAFSDSIAKHNNKKHIKLLWQHNQIEPIGSIEELYEDNYGLFAAIAINLNTQKGREASNLINQGALNGLSIGFEVEESEINSNNIRTITKAKLWEISIVTFPANENSQIFFEHREDTKHYSRDLYMLEKALGRAIATLS